MDNCPKHPSILLSNLLHRYNKSEGNLKILLIKERVSKSSESLDGLKNSYFCEIIVGEQTWDGTYSYLPT